MLAQTQEQLLDRLLELTPTSNADLLAAWEAANAAHLAALTESPPPGFQEIPEQWLVLVKRRDENLAPYFPFIVPLATLP